MCRLGNGGHYGANVMEMQNIKDLKITSENMIFNAFLITHRGPWFQAINAFGYYMSIYSCKSKFENSIIFLINLPSLCN